MVREYEEGTDLCLRDRGPGTLSDCQEVVSCSGGHGCMAREHEEGTDLHR